MPDQPVPDQPVQVLLVEDNDIDAELLLRAWRRHKIANPITRVIDGKEALNVLRGEGGRVRLPRPYIILLDINMPRMTGLEVLDVLRDDRELSHSVVYLLITDADDKARYAAYDGQLAGYIEKQHLVPAVLALLGVKSSG